MQKNIRRENARKRRWRNRRNFERHMAIAIEHTRAARRSQDLWWAAQLEVEAETIKQENNR